MFIQLQCHFLMSKYQYRCYYNKVIIFVFAHLPWLNELCFISQWSEFSIFLDNLRFHIKNTYFTCAWNLGGIAVQINRETLRLLFQILLKSSHPNRSVPGEYIFKYVAACKQLQNRVAFKSICTKIQVIYGSTSGKRQRKIKAKISVTSSRIERAEDT